MTRRKKVSLPHTRSYSCSYFIRHPSVLQSYKEIFQQIKEKPANDARFRLGSWICGYFLCIGTEPRSALYLPFHLDGLFKFSAVTESLKDSDVEEEEKIPSTSKRCTANVVTSPPESEAEMEDDEEQEQRTRAPITPRSRFLNRKRILTSDSEDGDVAGTYDQVRSSHKKPRTRPKSSEIEPESEPG